MKIENQEETFPASLVATRERESGRDSTDATGCGS